jgi:hypothetical protein
MNERINWLLEWEHWVEYRTRTDLLGQSENEPEVDPARKEIFSHPKIQLLLEELKEWPGIVLSNHKSASQPFHKLSFVAELGLREGDPNIDKIVEKIYEHKSDEGPSQLPTNIPKHFGGSGRNEWAWSLCYAPIIIYSLAKFGLGREEQAQKAVKYLVSIVHENGWQCVVSKELGKFRRTRKKRWPLPIRYSCNAEDAISIWWMEKQQRNSCWSRMFVGFMEKKLRTSSLHVLYGDRFLKDRSTICLVRHFACSRSAKSV